MPEISEEPQTPSSEKLITSKNILIAVISGVVIIILIGLVWYLYPK